MTSSHVSPQAAAQELLRRRQARSTLLSFTEYTYPTYKAEHFHHFVADTLDKVVSGEIDRLMLFAPPQHGKTELVSVRLPAYWFGKRPDEPIILTSYAASLAYRNSRHARNALESDEYRKLFPAIETNRQSRAVDHWEIAEHRGGLVAAGVGGPITGYGAMLGIIDDPFENWAQAQSETYRERVWEWWRATFRTRIWEGGAIILIMTRWHEDDLAGRLLRQDPDRWHVLRFPAIAETQEERDLRNKRMNLLEGEADPLGREPGEPLCPQRFSRETLEETRKDVGSRAWTAQYDGAPTRPEGNRFKRAWFPIVNAAPTAARRVRYWDKAGTAEAGAFTAGVLMAMTSDRIFYIDDVVRGQWSALERETTIKQTAQVDSLRYGDQIVVWVEQEPGSGGKESAESTIRNLAGFSVRADRPTGNKDIRLEPFAAQAEAMNVKLVRGPWNGNYIEEMCAIPNSRYRDQGDATAGAFNKLALHSDEPGEVERDTIEMW